MVNDEGCWACRAGVRHDERPEAECAHRLSDGSSRSCCGDAIAERVELRAAAQALRTGAVVPSVAEAMWHDDPVGSVWLAEDGKGEQR